jgi:hypothetical protein
MMKHTLFVATLVSTITFSGIFSTSSEAKEKKLQSKSQQSSEIHYSQAEASSSHKGARLQLGLSTITNAPAFSGATGIKGGTSITGLIELSHLDSIQVFFSIPTTNVSFNFDALGMYKRTIFDDGNYGIHVGAGFGLGVLNPAALGLAASTSNVILNFTGVAGFHFEVPGAPQIKIHLDAGPSFTLLTTTPSINSFQIGALSPALGLSVLYAI